jgi:hypothetical protein
MPAELSDNPGGSEPDAIVQLIGVVPEPVKENVYGMFWTPGGTGPLVTAGAVATTAGLIVIVKLCAGDTPAEFDACNENVYVPATVGVPDTLPLDARDKPPGRLPDGILHVNGADPAAENTYVYGELTVAAGKGDVLEIDGATLPVEDGEPTHMVEIPFAVYVPLGVSPANVTSWLFAESHARVSVRSGVDPAVGNWLHVPPAMSYTQSSARNRIPAFPLAWGFLW